MRTPTVAELEARKAILATREGGNAPIIHKIDRKIRALKKKSN